MIPHKPLKAPLIEWGNIRLRYQRLTVRHGDPRPAEHAVFTTDWWSGIYAEVEWREPGKWEWRVWKPLLHGTGRCHSDGEAASSAEARRLCMTALLGLDLTEAERDALVAVS